MERGSIQKTIEIGSCGVLADIDYNWHPGERRTRDYPGSPAEVEVTGVHVLGITSSDCEVEREGREDWFELADKITWDLLDHDNYQIAFEIERNIQDEREYALERKYEQIREERRFSA